MKNGSSFDVTAFLAGQIADCETDWSLGTFGALAEFSRDAEEPATVSHGGLETVTLRGGIRLAPLPAMRLFASEQATGESWGHRVALCLPTDRCAMSRRAVLTELGPDSQALRPQDSGAILFDLGLGAVQVDACIRVSDADLAGELREFVGRPVFEPGHPAMNLIVPASPHRIFIGRLGRIEVFQPIPPPDGESPDGPHTHVLPKLLRAGRTHSATEPVPEGFVPCAHFYPAHPVKDALGRALPFDARRHDAFQAMLRRFGDPAAVTLKERVLLAIAQGGAPAEVAVPNDRFARASVRVAIRQAWIAGEMAAAVWAEAHDKVREPETESETAH